jgi:hypothetical protein
MASLTIAIDPAVLEAAKLEAERRHVSLDQMVADLLMTVAPRRPTDEDNRQLLELMYSSPLGRVDKPLTREEIYAERTWPRS